MTNELVNPTTALLLVDIQNDFLPGGALPVRSGDEVIEVANRRIPDYLHVIATQDRHPADHLSFASQHSDKRIGEVIELDALPQVLWPDHCVQHTSGADFPKQLDTSRIQHIIRKGTDCAIDSYSGFFDNARRKATGLEEYLRGRGIKEIHVIGLATDYCVKATVLDAIDLGFRTVLLQEGVRGVELTPGDCDRAIAEMRSAGVEIL